MKPRICNQGKGRRRGLLAVLVGMALIAVSALAAPASQAAPEDYALSDTAASLSNAQAGRHADFETKFRIEGSSSEPSFGGNKPWASLRDILQAPPPGLIGNPAAFPTCNTADFLGQTALLSGDPNAPVCEPDTQIGLLSPGLAGILEFPPGLLFEPLYNLEAPGGDSHVVARLGFIALIYPMFIDIKVDPMRDNALTATVVNPPALVPLVGADTRLWGAPTDESHNTERYNLVEAIQCGHSGLQPDCTPFVVPSGLQPTAFMTNPTSCGPTQVDMATDSYQRYGDYDFAVAPLAEITDCDSVPFEPNMALNPTTRSPAASSGLDVSLQIPQDGLLNPEGAASAHLKKAVVTLPKGMTLNASSADGLGSCTEEQIGLHRNERQLVAIGGHGAPVSLSFGGQSTGLLPQYASAAGVEAALESLPDVGAGNVTVTGRVGGPWNVEFTGSLSAQNVGSLGGSYGELERLAIRAEGGTYKLGFEGAETTPIPLAADAAAVQSALEGLPGIAPGSIDVTGGNRSAYSPGRPAFRLAFGGALAGVDVPDITVSQELEGFELAQIEELIKGGSPVAAQTEQEGGTIRFDAEDPQCPESSKVATGEIETPVLKGKLKASFYLAKQDDNPFNSLFAGYLVASGQGVTLKVPAKIDIDPDTGQIVTTFDNNPQQPFSDLELRFKGGNRGLMTTPQRCGTYTSTYELTPWSGQPPTVGASEFTLDQNCGDAGFSPGFHAGSSNPLAGSFTTFVTQVTRGSGSPALTGVSVNMPPGLTAKLAGLPSCPESALASVKAAPGTGVAEIGAPSCPAASRIGKVVAGTGSGAPFYVDTGKVYLAGPYKGSPLSLAVVAPAVAGPFDLGSVLVRVGIDLDRVTAQVHATSDPIPTMLQGIPLDIRDLRVYLDRSGFALNPTSCEAMAATAKIDGTGGASANVSDRFQVGECAALGFKPKMTMRLKGGSTRAKHPALTVVLRPRAGDANIAGISVRFPGAEFLDQSHIGTICTRAQFAADACPAASIYGSVAATTPLLDDPLTGYVYLRSNPEHELPDVVTDLRGPANRPIRLEAAGRIDSVNKGLRSSFEFVPDAPLTRVVLKMKGGSKGLLQNSRNLCADQYRANVQFKAHNGKTYAAHPPMQIHCSGGKRGKGKPRNHKHG